jgi:hypothetical protein
MVERREDSITGIASYILSKSADKQIFVGPLICQHHDGTIQNVARGHGERLYARSTIAFISLSVNLWKLGRALINQD